MMSPQQQQILVRSALAAGLTLAVGLVGVGFASGDIDRREAASTGAIEAPVAETDVEFAVGQLVFPADTVRQTERAAIEGAPVAPAATLNSAGGSTSAVARAFVRDDDDDDEGEHRERERESAREAFRRISERRERR